MVLDGNRDGTRQGTRGTQGPSSASRGGPELAASFARLLRLDFPLELLRGEAGAELDKLGGGGRLWVERTQQRPYAGKLR